MNIEDSVKQVFEDDELDDCLVNTIELNYARMMVTASKKTGLEMSELRPKLYLVTTEFNDFSKSFNGKSRSINRRDDSGCVIPDVSRKKWLSDDGKIFSILERRQQDFYHHVINQVVPNNCRPSNYWLSPTVLSFTDLANSRFSSGSISIYPHAHAIYVIPPLSVEKFESLWQDGFRLSPRTRKTAPMKLVKCDPIHNTHPDKLRVTSYCAKMMKKKTGQFRWFDKKFDFFTMFGRVGKTEWRDFDRVCLSAV